MNCLLSHACTCARDKAIGLSVVVVHKNCHTLIKMYVSWSVANAVKMSEMTKKERFFSKCLIRIMNSIYKLCF